MLVEGSEITPENLEQGLKTLRESVREVFGDVVLGRPSLILASDGDAINGVNINFREGDDAFFNVNFPEKWQFDTENGPRGVYIGFTLPKAEAEF